MTDERVLRPGEDFNAKQGRHNRAREDYAGQ